ncbi:MAG: hypothetical protein HOU81_00775 [Hamadaea sp.]|uniref:hypothetical protein n=1 Tax=Hamadaea sp. TaxID=2024425 RepID=UPI0017FD99C7|nr:hypothetical protein [Hamadaea sp.]NUR69331.1 hypothetical protein [Hamadaea sp.]NUT21965.1 hypothetical protein [Hamadaea sp.]
METRETSAEPALEISCDESGWEGSNFAAANSDVIAYASVRLPIEAAEECIRLLRGRSEWHRHEFKAGHLIRNTDGAGLAAFLGPDGPVHGRARVHLTHKSCFIILRVLDIFLGDFADTVSLGLRPDPRLASAAAELCRTGREVFGPERWRAFLAAINLVLRENRHPKVHAPVDAFFDQVDALRPLAGDGWIGELFDELRNARGDGYTARIRLLDNHVLQPVLEPLLPALARTVLHWSAGTQPIAIVHDEQSALTEKRIQRLEQVLAEPPLELISRPIQGPFLRFRQTDSRIEPRVQVADVLAGVTRKIMSGGAVAASHPGLTDLLEPYLEPASCWCGWATDPAL